MQDIGKGFIAFVTQPFQEIEVDVPKTVDGYLGPSNCCIEVRYTLVKSTWYQFKYRVVLWCI